MHRLGLLAPFALALGLEAALPKDSPAESLRPHAVERLASSSPSEASAPLVALLVTEPQGETTGLVFQQPGAEVVGQPVATLHHRRGGTAKGALLPDTRAVLAVADMPGGRDLSWGAHLVRLEEGREPVVLADRVYTSTRPLVLNDGSVLVQRGRAGEEPSQEEAASGRLRVDAITIDAVDPDSGDARTIHAYVGYLAFLAGALDREAFVYRVGPENADIVAVDVDSGKARVLADSIPPSARDFSVDEESGSLIFTTRHERSRETCVVERLDLQTKARTRLLSGRRMALVPHAWPGALAFNPDGEEGLTLLLPNGRTRSLRPLGDGVDLVRGFSHDTRFAALSHTRPGELPVPYVLSLATGDVLPVTVADGMRVDIAGVLR